MQLASRLRIDRRATRSGEKGKKDHQDEGSSDFSLRFSLVSVANVDGGKAAARAGVCRNAGGSATWFSIGMALDPVG